MEKRPPQTKTMGKPQVSVGKPTSLESDTKMVRDTITPEENDPVWDELGSTRIVDSKNDGAAPGADSDSSTNYTEISPSRILGKNLVMLGDYKLQQKIGEGAMGAVYKALQMSFEGVKLEKPVPVALKVLFPHVASNPKLVARLYREGTVMNQLDHPNIIQAYAVGEAEGCHFVAMEYVAGLSMQKWLAKVGSLPVADAVHITLACAQALAYAHSLGMVHRDIKPDNILLTQDGIVKVADLGMVKTHDEDMSLTQTGHAVGTPWYMPLEQARNSKEIDGRSDIYALGCTLYAFITGRPPFTGRTLVDVIQAKDVGTFPLARQGNPDVPERLDLILAKMTAKLAKYRYQSCEELIKDLQSLQLASEKLTFLQAKPAITKEQEDEKVSKMRSTVANALIQSKVETPVNIQPIDPNLWYVQIRIDGKKTTRKFATALLQEMLTNGKIKPTAQVSRSATEGFRALATYMEFQGAVLSKMAKKAADKSTSRNRGIYKELEEQERQRAEKEQDNDRDENQMQATLRHWGGIFLKILPLALGLLFIIWYLFLHQR